MLTAKEVAYEVTKALDMKKGMDIKLLKINEVSSLADYSAAIAFTGQFAAQAPQSTH